MSKTQHKATLATYGEPFFPDEIDLLHEQLDRRSCGGDWLVGVAKMFGGYTDYDNPFMTTSDGYCWFRAIKLDKDVVILIPWIRDQSNADGTRADRSIAVYSAVGEDEANELVRTFLVRFSNALRYYNDMVLAVQSPVATQ